MLGGRSITEFNYRYAGGSEAQIFVGVGLRGGEEEQHELQADLADNGYTFTDLSDNELAKLHIRYMVGGKPPVALEERLLRFEFPEYPGALLRFLETLGSEWNITLFHYRNHGAAKGQVLAGFQMGAKECPKFEEHLARLGYSYQDETNNPCFAQYLQSSEEYTRKVG